MFACGAHVRTFRKNNMHKIVKPQKAMYRKSNMIVIYALNYRKQNEWMRNITKVRDVKKQAAKLKWIL